MFSFLTTDRSGVATSRLRPAGWRHRGRKPRNQTYPVSVRLRDLSPTESSGGEQGPRRPESGGQDWISTWLRIKLIWFHFGSGQNDPGTRFVSALFAPAPDIREKKQVSFIFLREKVSVFFRIGLDQSVLLCEEAGTPTADWLTDWRQVAQPRQ